MVKNYKIYIDAYGKERDKARELYDQLSLRRHQRDDYMRMFGEFPSDMELKFSSYTILFVDTENIEKDAKNIDPFDYVVNKSIDYECKSMILSIATHA